MKTVFYRLEPAVELSEAQPAIQIIPIIIVGVFLLLFLGCAVFLYFNKQPEAGRLVIDLAIAFFAWATGKAMGEKSGLSNRP